MTSFDPFIHILFRRHENRFWSTLSLYIIKEYESYIYLLKDIMYLWVITTNVALKKDLT